MLPVLIRLPKDLHDALKAAAEERGVSMAECAREAIVLWLEARRTG
jgi:predicted HicB family RNase H-like nuclease